MYTEADAPQVKIAKLWIFAPVCITCRNQKAYVNKKEFSVMNEAVTKRFLLYFRLMLLVWILIANSIIHLTGMEYSWLIFLSNIMMFTLETNY